MQSKQRASGRTVSAEQAVVLENIEHTTHLAEDEDTRALRLHVLEQLVENDHLARVLDEMLIGGVRRSWFCSVKEIGMASDFPKLHDNVHESCLALLLAGKA